MLSCIHISPYSLILPGDSPLAWGCFFFKTRKSEGLRGAVFPSCQSIGLCRFDHRRQYDLKFEGNSVALFSISSWACSFDDSLTVLFARTISRIVSSQYGDSHPAPRRLYAPQIELILNFICTSLPALLQCYFYAAAYSGGLRNRTSNTSTRGQSPRVVSPSGSAWP